MTTIAYDGEILATDSRMTQDSYLTTDKAKKIFIFKEPITYLDDELLVCAFSGRCADWDKFLHYIVSDNFPCGMSHNVSGIIVGKKYAYELEHDTGYLIRHNKKTKLVGGSGGVFAQSAMLLGFNAKEAVKHAMKLDMASGGRVQSWNNKRTP